MAAIVQKDSQEVRNQRLWQYLVILVEEAGVNPKRVPPEMGPFAVLSPYERRGYTTQNIETWISICDPVIKPAWDEVACFRRRVKGALSPKPALGATAAIAAGVVFAGAYMLTRARR